MKIPGLSTYQDSYGDSIELYASKTGKCMVSFKSDGRIEASTHIESLEELQRFAAAIQEFIDEASEGFGEDEEVVQVNVNN